MNVKEAKRIHTSLLYRMKTKALSIREQKLLIRVTQVIRYAKRVRSNPQKVICDFCSSVNVKWRLMALTFETELPKDLQEASEDMFGGARLRGYQFVDDWAACDPCFKLVQARRKVALIERSLVAFYKLHPDSTKGMTRHDKLRLRAELKRIHDGFWLNYFGVYEELT